MVEIGGCKNPLQGPKGNSLISNYVNVITDTGYDVLIEKIHCLASQGLQTAVKLLS